MTLPQKISDLLDKLIGDARKLLKGSVYYGGSGEIKDKDGLRRWSNELILFKSLCGDLIRPWVQRLQHNGVVIIPRSLEGPLSALETIRYAVDGGLLTSYEELIFGRAFADLFEQGEYLYSEGYHLAAGVIFRAVLEERLRRLCTRHECMPSKERPSINDFNTSLYKHDPPIYDKSMMLQVTALAAVGNDAAHNSPNLTPEDVKRLMDGVRDFLARFSE